MKDLESRIAELEAAAEAQRIVTTAVFSAFMKLAPASTVVAIQLMTEVQSHLQNSRDDAGQRIALQLGIHVLQQGTHLSAELIALEVIERVRRRSSGPGDGR